MSMGGNQGMPPSMLGKDGQVPMTMGMQGGPGGLGHHSSQSMGMGMQGPPEMYMEPPFSPGPGGMGFGQYPPMHPDDMMFSQPMHPDDVYGAQGMHPDEMIYAQGMHPEEQMMYAQDIMGGVVPSHIDGVDYFPPQRFQMDQRRHLGGGGGGGMMHNGMMLRRPGGKPGLGHHGAPMIPSMVKTSPHDPAAEVTVADDNDSLASPSDEAGKSMNGKKPRAPSSSSFPIKLHKILSDPQYREYIAWLPHGRAWRVLKPKAFEEIVIPKFFRSDRYASFMRQVNGWGFKRITEGPDLNAYYHEMFLRGLPGVCARMRRPQKGAHSPHKELGECPDFYKISMFAPLPDPDAPGGLPRQSHMSNGPSGQPGMRRDQLSQQRPPRKMIRKPVEQQQPPPPTLQPKPQLQHQQHHRLSMLASQDESPPSQVQSHDPVERVIKRVDEEDEQQQQAQQHPPTPSTPPTPHQDRGLQERSHAQGSQEQPNQPPHEDADEDAEDVQDSNSKNEADQSSLSQDPHQHNHQPAVPLDLHDAHDQHKQQQSKMDRSSSRSQTPSSVGSHVSHLSQVSKGAMGGPVATASPHSPHHPNRSPERFMSRMPQSPTFLSPAGVEEHSLTSWPDHEQGADMGWGGNPYAPMEGAPVEMGFRMGPHVGVGGGGVGGVGGMIPGRLMGDYEQQLSPSSSGSRSNVPDSGGLSVADLCYLTQQNRVLLRQARGGRPS